ADVRAETQIENVVTEEQLLPVHDQFYRLHKVNEQFKGTLITIDQYRQLTLDEDKVVNFYDDDQNLVNRIKTRKDAAAHRIVTNSGGNLQVYPLETLQQERTEIIPKQPHKVVADFWDERCRQLQHYVEQQRTRIAEEFPPELAGADRHLFVDTSFAEVVQANLEEVRGALEQLALRLEKIQFAYRAVRA
ncbi:MAG: ATPase, partial [Bacteroidota bacterium]